MERQALLLNRSYQLLHHAVLLRRVRADELLLQTIAIHRSGVSPTGED